MNRPLTFTLCVAIGLVSVGLYRLLDAGRELTVAQKGAAQKALREEGEKTRVWATEVLLPLGNRTLDTLDARAASIQRDAAQQLTGVRQDVQLIAAQLQTEVGETRRELLTRVDSIRADLSPALQSVSASSEELYGAVAELHKTLADLHPQALGLIAASKVTAGETAQTMKDVRGAVPEFLKTLEDAAQHVDAAAAASAEASQNTAKLTANLAAATKPLPKGVRLGLQVLGPLSQIASYVILMLSTLGVL